MTLHEIILQCAIRSLETGSFFPLSRELVAEIGATESRISRAVAQLAQEGTIVFRACPGGRRRIHEVRTGSVKPHPVENLVLSVPGKSILGHELKTKQQYSAEDVRLAVLAISKLAYARSVRFPHASRLAPIISKSLCRPVTNSQVDNHRYALVAAGIVKIDADRKILSVDLFSNAS